MTMTTIEEVDMGIRTEPEHTVTLENNQILETIREAMKTGDTTMKAELLVEIKKDNQQKFDQLSERLQSIEHSIYCNQKM
ncbi:unnamed protein product [Caenorhabditis nigoni]